MDDKTRFNTEGKPTWCPGCGNFGIQAAVKKALIALEKAPHEVVISSGIGCSGKIPHWIRVNGFHGLHGRALPVASGIKMANPSLTVIAEGGDGDGYSEGLNHFLQAARRNHDITYLVHNNGVFGLTTGQTSPTGRRGFVSSTTPAGQIESPMRPLALALSAGATYVARGFSGDLDHLSGLIASGITHRGFAFVDIMQVCVSFNPDRSYSWYQKRLEKLEQNGHDPSDFDAAMALAYHASEKLPVGVFYRNAQSVPYEDEVEALRGTPPAERAATTVDVSSLMTGMI